MSCQERPHNRTRAFKPKVTTGCLTCKTRRVKCDETKPTCQRCDRSGYACDGYELHPRKWKRKPSQVQWKVPETLNPTSYEPRLALFDNEQEIRYFQLFCDKTALQLSGYFDSQLWSQLVLQACQTDPPIRHVVVAIAALDVTLQSARWGPKQEDLDNNAHHYFALKQYSKAISQMRKAAMEGKSDFRSTLISCLVLTCFETFHGNSELAAAQVRIALGLITRWFVEKGAYAPTSNPSSVLSGSISASSNSTSPVSTPSSSPGSTQLSSTISTSLPQSLDEELVQAFGRLDIQAMCFLDGRYGSYHQEMKYYNQDRIEAMPQIFTTMKQARSYLELIMQRFLHFRSSLTQEFETLVGSRGVQSNITVEEIAVDGERYHRELQRWRSAFDPISVIPLIDADQKDFLGATGLRLQYLASYVGIPTDDGRSSMRNFMPIFCEMLPLARSIITHPRVIANLSRFTFDCQVIVPLYVVAMRCPHRSVRREAVSLLLMVPKREGLWDGLLAANVANFVIELEEEGVVDGEFICHGREVRGIDVKFDMLTRSASVQCLIPQAESEDLAMRQKMITW